MRSRAARSIVGAVAWIAILGVGVFLVQSEKRLSGRRAAARAFDLHAREAADLLAELRASQQAYIAAGQGVAFWMPKVAATADAAATIVAGLRQTAPSIEVKAPLDEAANSLAEFGDVDQRARDYIKTGQPLMAADVVFTEGAPTVVDAARHVERARLAEHQALDAVEASQRRQEATALAAAALAGALAVALLVPIGKLRARAQEAWAELASRDLALREQPAESAASRREASTLLRSAAQLCTDFARLSDVDSLKALLPPAAQMIEASGLVVWLGNTSGIDLRPVLAHGYSSQTLARMPTVPRSADNAAAAAYRTGVLQIVLARPGSSNGAVVAPLLTPDGCIGALTAELTSGGETSDAVQALATIFAAQLSGVLNAAAAAVPEADRSQTASA